VKPPESDEYLKRAIAEYRDSYFGNGVQSELMADTRWLTSTNDTTRTEKRPYSSTRYGKTILMPLRQMAVHWNRI
jgi:hypothetical protein